MLDFNALEGKTLMRCWNTDSAVHFVVSEEESYTLAHEQECCEEVYLESVDGDLADLVGSPILLAEKTSNSGNCENNDWDTFTWTFYKLATVKGWVTLRFYGTSNGYYSEEVDFTRD
jgi:hypothetical protein